MVDHLQPVHAGQHPVDHHDVEWLVRGHTEPILPVRDVVYLVAGAVEPLDDVLRNRRVVFNHQNTHPAP